MNINLLKMNNFYEQPKFLIWIQSILFLLLGIFLGIVIIAEGNDQPLFYLCMQIPMDKS